MTPAGAEPDPGPSLEPEHVHSVAPPSSGQPSSFQSTWRRTGRSTADQHSNIHSLLQPVGIRGNGVLEFAGPVVNAQSVLFRPWS